MPCLYDVNGKKKKRDEVTGYNGHDSFQPFLPFKKKKNIVKGGSFIKLPPDDRIAPKKMGL
jgi:hypothetical protein